jgi:hypothetical protein
VSDAFGYDRFLIDQLVRPIANLYRVTPLATGETPAGGPVAFVRQKKLAIKEDIRFYADEDEAQELFRIKARAVLEIGGRYDVTDTAGARIGVLEKVFGKSLLRSTWRILDAARDQHVPVDAEQVLAVEACLLHLCERADRLRLARNRHAMSPIGREGPDEL